MWIKIEFVIYSFWSEETLVEKDLLGRWTRLIDIGLKSENFIPIVTDLFAKITNENYGLRYFCFDSF